LAGHLAYTLIFFSFLVRNILWLRGLAIFASLTSIIYNFYVPAEPLWVPIQWNCVFIMTNIVQITFIFLEKRNFKLEGHEAYLHDRFFPDLTSAEFKSLLRGGFLRTSQKNETLIEQHTTVEALMVIIDGEVSVQTKGREVARLGKGHFLGEMSFMTDEPTKADVCAIGEVQYFFWEKESLKALINKKPKMMNAIQRVLSHQLIEYILDEDQKADNNYTPAA
ncbi:MAG: hypothetical protein ACJARO_001029, partial [Bacteriovoracaceae bacterium]